MYCVGNYRFFIKVVYLVSEKFGRGEKMWIYNGWDGGRNVGINFISVY